MIDCLTTADASITGMVSSMHAHAHYSQSWLLWEEIMWHLVFFKIPDFSKAHMLHTDTVVALATGCWEDCYVFFQFEWISLQQVGDETL